MHKKHAAFVAAAAVLAIIFAVGTAAITRSDGAAPVPAAAPEATADPVGADDWMYLQRANDDGSIPAAAVTEAIAQSKAAGEASKGSPSTDQVWTNLGPSNIGGRLRDIAADPAHQGVVYIATGSGGVWKSTDGGATFSSTWGSYLPQSVGAVAVDSHGVVWVGTGEVDHGGGSAYYGNGVYKSTDGGTTWTNVGLQDGDTTGRIVIDPRDDNRVFVAVQGALHDTNPIRGLYLTEDGGGTWTRVLTPASASTGAIDVAIDKGNPDVMLATTWDKIRDEKSRLYGPNSFVYRSTDAGHTWTNVHNAPLPQSETDAALQTPDNLVG
ncbi:MAG: WD40/YVTN/BNR-like repeat-containing protein, partial [Gaiellaceae bacterium]